MVELGEQHALLHRDLGIKAAECVDLAVVVKPDRIPTFVEGFLSRKKNHSDLLSFKTLAEATEWLPDNLRACDIILFENDLPDLYERTLQL
jgi:UDP-N-acetylmuramoyl-tripeptide--D-alanyl-D-alanine ligase